MSVYIERMTQMSSTHSPTCGNSSLTSMPLWPYFLNVNGDVISAPVLRSVATVPPGSGWPSYLSSIGFGVEGVDLRQAAVHEQEDDALGPRRMIELARRRRCRRAHGAGARQRLADHAGERHHAEAAAHPAERVAAGQRLP